MTTYDEKAEKPNGLLASTYDDTYNTELFPTIKEVIKLKQRFGKSKDYSQAKRRHIYETVKKFEGKLSYTDIAQQLLDTNYMVLSHCRKSKWFQEMKKQDQNLMSDY